MLQTHFRFTPRTALAPRLGLAATGLDSTAWDRIPAIGSFFSRPNRAALRYPLEVKIARTGRNLSVRFRATDPDTSGLVSRTVGAKHHRTSWWFDFIEMLFDPAHTHSQIVKVRFDPAGEISVFDSFILPGELYGDRLIDEKPRPVPRGLRLETRITATAWEGVAILPAALFGPGVTFTHPWGLQILRYRPRHVSEVAIWQPEPASGAPTPQDYGDLYFEDRGPRPTTIDCGRVVFDRNTLKLTFDRPAERPLQVRASVRLPADRRIASDRKVTLPRGRKSVQVPFTVAMDGRWPIQKEGYQRLYIEVSDRGRCCFAASYVLAYDVGIRVEDPYGQPKVHRPRPTDPDFLRKYNQYICGRLPWFRRLTTRDGCRGDFVLAAADNSVRFDLMRPDVLDRIVHYIYGRYDNDMDRLVGASMFLHQRAVTCHSSSGSAVANIDAAGMLRLCGALCGNRAQALTLLLAHMRCETTRRLHRTHMLGLAGHIVTLVDPLASQDDDDHAFEDHLVLDPDIGQLLVSADNRRIATLAELRADKSLSYRGNFNNFRHGHEFYFGTDHQILNDPTVWGSAPDFVSHP